jgi:hypothetical protein
MEAPCITTTTLLIDITNVHAIITACQNRWGVIRVIGGRLMSARPLLWSQARGVTGMRSCNLLYSLSVSADSHGAEHPSPSQMPRYNVIPPIRLNHDHIVKIGPVLSCSIEDATNDKYGDRVGGVKTTRAPPSTIVVQRQYYSHGTLFFPPKTVRTKDNGDTPLLMSPLPVNAM